MAYRAVVPVVLRGGPEDGLEDHLLEPLPLGVVVAYCAACRRRHPFTLGTLDSDHLPLYELDSKGGMGGDRGVYRHVDVDVDDELDQLRHLGQLPSIA